jgi:hypothetical protein
VFTGARFNDYANDVLRLEKGSVPFIALLLPIVPFFAANPIQIGGGIEEFHLANIALIPHLLSTVSTPPLPESGAGGF